jgi:hypothetical protein
MTPIDFYTNRVVCDSFCSLEVSMIGDIGNLPYLEYRIEHGTTFPSVDALMISRGETSGFSDILFGRISQRQFISGIGFPAQ